MALLIDEPAKDSCKGITIPQGAFHSDHVLAHGNRMIDGVTPGMGGRTYLGLPVCSRVHEAARKTRVNSSDRFMPPPVVGSVPEMVKG